MTKAEREARQIERLARMTEYEREFWCSGMQVAGMDEAGRGPLAGPVVAACVIMPSDEDKLLPEVNDSKQLSEKKRIELYKKIISSAISYGVGWVDAATIDKINILQATKLAFKLAFENMSCSCSHVLVDAVEGIDIDARQYPIIHGDARSYSIAAASIIAKVQRDMYMTAQDELYPAYGFAKHKGYGTAQHAEAIRRYGLCILHRRSFCHKFTSDKP